MRPWVRVDDPNSPRIANSIECCGAWDHRASVGDGKHPLEVLAGEFGRDAGIRTRGKPALFLRNSGTGATMGPMSAARRVVSGPASLRGTDRFVFLPPRL